MNNHIMRIFIKEKAYGFINPKVIISDIDISFKKGESYLIIGASGAGKSTLIRCITGMTSFDGRTENFNRSDIAYIPQFPALNNDRTVNSEVYFSRKFACLCDRTLPSDNIDEVVRSQLRSVGIDSLADRPIHSLSGGQKQRVSICKEAVRGKHTIIGDELDTGLDVGTARSIIRNLCDITHKQGLTTIVISHNITNLMLFDNLIVLAKDSHGVGRLAYVGKPTNALSFFDAKDYTDILARINIKIEGGMGLADQYIAKYSQDSSTPSRRDCYLAYLASQNLKRLSTDE